MRAPGPPPRWRRPEGASPGAVDVVEVARVEGGVLVRTSLSATAIPVSGGAWEAFVEAVKRGEFDVAEARPGASR